MDGASWCFSPFHRIQAPLSACTGGRIHGIPRPAAGRPQDSAGWSGGEEGSSAGEDETWPRHRLRDGFFLGMSSGWQLALRGRGSRGDANGLSCASGLPGSRAHLPLTHYVFHA